MSYYQAVHIRLCPNCGKKLQGREKPDGAVTYECSMCGYAAISKRTGRARFVVDEFFNSPGTVFSDERDYIPDEDDLCDDLAI